MEPTKLPSEAIDAYNLFIHGHIDRRAFMDRITRLAVSTTAAAAMVNQLMPNSAAAQQVSPTDSRLKAEYASVPSPNGNGTIRG
jgi:carboxymethylenebutenolidase